MFVDASAIASVLLREPIARRLVERLDSLPKGQLVTNVIAVWEVVTAIQGKRGGLQAMVEAEVATFLGLGDIETLPITPDDLALALVAFDRHGRHRVVDPRQRNKALNLADCFHYATAKSRRIPMLTIDEGFAATDLQLAPF